MSTDGMVSFPPHLGGHTLRTFKLGPKEGTVWECWCGETSEPDEYLSQDFARHGHEFHQLAEEEV